LLLYLGKGLTTGVRRGDSTMSWSEGERGRNCTFSCNSRRKAVREEGEKREREREGRRREKGRCYSPVPCHYTHQRCFRRDEKRSFRLSEISSNPSHFFFPLHSLSLDCCRSSSTFSARLHYPTLPYDHLQATPPSAHPPAPRLSSALFENLPSSPSVGCTLHHSPASNHWWCWVSLS
jgi:hypothetical protein